MYRLLVWSSKRGVGKTTSVANLGPALARRGTDVLLVGFDAHQPDLDTIRRAYRRQSKDFHPDLHQGTARASTELMITLNQAWEILRSPEMRRAYDWLEQQRTKKAVA